MTLLQQLTLKYWWVALFALSTSSLFEFKLFQLKSEALSFQTKRSELELMKKKLLKESSHLKEELYSLDDPDFVTLVLIKTLGVVPDGETKVSF